MRPAVMTLVMVAFTALGVAAPADETTPVPPDQLRPGVALVSPDRVTETYGSISTTWSGVPRERGNVFSVTSPANVTQIEFFLNPSAPETIYFPIYRKTNDGTLTGTYTQDFITSVSVTSIAAPLKT